MAKPNPKTQEENFISNLGLEPVSFPGIKAKYDNRELGYYFVVRKHDPAVRGIQTAAEQGEQQQIEAMEAYAAMLAEALEERYIEGEHVTGEILLTRFNKSINALGAWLLRLGPDPLALAATLE